MCVRSCVMYVRVRTIIQIADRYGSAFTNSLIDNYDSRITRPLPLAAQDIAWGFVFVKKCKRKSKGRGGKKGRREEIEKGKMKEGDKREREEKREEEKRKLKKQRERKGGSKERENYRLGKKII